MSTLDEKASIDVEKLSISYHEHEISSETGVVIDAEAEARLVRRIDVRLVPMSALFYLLSFLDRANIGNARILNSDTGDDLEQTIHLSDQQYLVALMIFIVSYTIFEIPSNYMLKKFRPSRWFALIMLGWGIFTMLLAAVKNFAGIVVIRFMLGAFEAGLFPGIIYTMTFWYKQDERAVRAAWILGGASLAGAFGGAAAFGVGHIDRVGGLEGWKWLFIIEGVPSCLCAVLAYLSFPDFPESSTWLSERERALAVERIRGVASLGHEKPTWRDAKATLLDWRLYLHYMACVAFCTPFSCVSLFIPTIVSGIGYQGLSAQLFAVPPYAIAFVVTVFVGWQADKRGARSWAAFSCFMIAGLSFIAQGALPASAFKARYALLCVAVPFSFAINPPLLSWLTANVTTTGAMTLALPLNQSLGQLGQLLGIYIYKPSEAPRYPTGHFTNAGFVLTGAVVCVVLRSIYERRNRLLQPGERRWQL